MATPDQPRDYSPPFAPLTAEQVAEFETALGYADMAEPEPFPTGQMSKVEADAYLARLPFAVFKRQSVPRTIEWLRGRGEHITAGQLDLLCSWHDRNAGPSILFDLFVAGLVDTDTLRAVMVGVWNAAELPEVLVERAVWLVWFERVGYTVNGVTAERPAEPVRLYRGCEPQHVRRMAWSTDLELASWFAERHKGLGQQACVYVADVAPWRLLARITDDSGGHFRRESEMIIDPRRMSYRQVIQLA